MIAAGLGVGVAAAVFVSVALPAGADAFSPRRMDAATTNIARQAHDAASEGDRFLAAMATVEPHAPYFAGMDGQ